MEQQYGNEDLAEIFNLEIKPDDLGSFMHGGEQAHEYLQKFQGYNGIDIIMLSEIAICVQINWKGYKLFDQFLPIILNGCVITEWLKNAVTISHRPAIVKKLKLSLLNETSTA